MFAKAKGSLCFSSIRSFSVEQLPFTLSDPTKVAEHRCLMRTECGLYRRGERLSLGSPFDTAHSPVSYDNNRSSGTICAYSGRSVPLALSVLTDPPLRAF